MINELKKGHHLGCGEFSVYDYDAMSIQELLSTFFTTINECVKETNELSKVSEWLVKEGLSIEVVEKLLEWKEDGTLAEIINHKIFEELSRSITYFDLKQNPVLYTGVKGKETSVMQDIHILKNKNILISQIASSSVAETESFTVTQCTVKGDIINYMTIKNGGHGNFTAYESLCGNVYIVFCDNQNQLRKIEYIAGTFEIEDAEIIYKATNERAYPKINNDKNILALTMKNNQGEYYCTDVFDLKKYMNSESFKPLKHVEHGQIGVFQGSAIDDKKLYLYYGYVNAIIQIVEIDLTTCERNEYEYPHIVNATNAGNTTTEAEGMCIANNQLFIGVALGEPTVLRENCIFSFLPVNKIMNTLNTILNNVQMFKLTEASGTAKSFKHNNNLKNIIQPGEYYFTATQFLEIEDVPEYLKNVNSGYFLSVSARAKDGAVVQTLTRNTTGNNRFVISRSLSLDRTASDWSPVTPERKTLWSGDSKSLNQISVKENIWNFDFINVRVGHVGGYMSQQIFLNDIKNSKRLIFHGHNLTDNDSTTFTPWELQCTISEDGMTINYDLKNELVISDSGITKRASSVGIQNIQGVRGFKALP